MSNMSYVRFENTYIDLNDCMNHIEDKNLSDSEKRYRDKLIELCREVADYEDSWPEDYDEEKEN